MLKKNKNEKNYDYFDFFCTNAEYACEAAKALHETFLNFDPNTVLEKVNVIHKIENDADMARHVMTEHLVKEFIPPIEREDIVEMAQQMDSVVDAIDDVMRRVYMFGITSIRPESLVFTDLIVKCCNELLAAVQEFRHFKKSSTLRNHIVAVNTLESEGDQLHADAIRALFHDNIDAKGMLVWMTMIECMESCLDACEDTVDIIETVVMKNS